jgi:SAM-dependent methyltransferase
MWDERYNTAEYMYGKTPNDFLQANIKHLPTGNVLCLADGEGRNSVYLAKCGYRVTAVDLSAVALKKARQLADESQVKVDFIHADLANFNFGEQQWDGVVSIFCHLPAALRARVHRSLCRGLKKNGTYLVEGYTPKQLQYKTGGPGSAEMMLSAGILTKELHHMHPLFVTEKERMIQEGILHRGKSHVVQGVFVKV